jgi:histone H3/H4
MVRRKVAYRSRLGAKGEGGDDGPTEYKRAPPVSTKAGKGGRKPKDKGEKKQRVPRSVKSLPDTTLRRAVIVHGPKRVGPKAVNAIRTQVEDVVAAVVADATRSAACEGRKTIKGRDTRRALKARGIILV